MLGELRHKSLLHVQTEVDPKTGALLARNPFNTEFAERIAFVDVSDSRRTFTGDRKEFLGRNGSLSNPAALKRTRLSGKAGAGLDPCGAVQVTLDLPAGQQRETTFRLGVGRSVADVQTLIRRFRPAEASRGALEGVWEYWNRTLGAVQVETPDPSVNVMANGWLLYQTLSSRLWARTGFYQSGGAFGFRDQLQDVMALVHAEPALTREHLLRAAAHQFREGDVQHWWHPPAGRGVRTHFSDDYLWLPYATCRYVACVADTGVLDESIPFLEGRPLKPEEDSYYDLPNRSEASATLYQHCVRAIEHGLKFGQHGLPLMGCGDWNDGMNLVGKEGRGESVWLAFFLYDVLTQFAELARRRNDTAFAERCLAQAHQLQQNIEQHAWDGQWYRRAYFDNGEPLGSRTNPECQIDSLPQSWSVISRAGNPQRARQAMQAVDERLIRRDAGLIQLFDPPFDQSSLNPGYIKGYFPGVRENGGQYTHGAIWTTMAFALMGDTDRAWDLFALLNPVHHSATPSQIATYKVEPYVVACRRLWRRAPHRPWRLDLVHRFRRLDVSAPARNPARRESGRQSTAPHPQPSRDVEHVHPPLPLSANPLPHSHHQAPGHPSGWLPPIPRRSGARWQYDLPCWTTTVIILWKCKWVNDVHRCLPAMPVWCPQRIAWQRPGDGRQSPDWPVPW